MQAALVVLVLGTGLVAASTAGMLRGVEPFATWYYPLAWYPLLAGADAVVRLRTGRWALITRPRAALAALGWSIPFWLFFEAINLRVANWYYVFVPSAPVPRWCGIALSFATVLPAVLLAREVARAFGVGERMRSPPLRLPPGPAVIQGLGLACFALSFAWPRLFFPLVWGGVTLLVDPWVYRRAPERSLLGALERGHPATPVQLLVGGLAVGLLWEALNARARGHWIYTVPGLEELKLFEMPVAGFLGFPILALDAWAAWNALVLLGLTPDVGAEASGPPDTARASGRRVAWTAVACAPACFAVLAGMDRWTNSSVTPDLGAVAPGGEAPLERAGLDVFGLAEAEPERVAGLAAVSREEASAWIHLARLVALRGIGVENARWLEKVGAGSVEALARSDPTSLTAELHRAGAPLVRGPRVRVWVRGARAALSRAGP